MGVIILEEFEREKARPLGLVIAIAALGLSSRLGATDERPRASGFLAGRVDRIAESVVPMVIDAIDLDSVLERVDLDAMLERVDLDAMLERVDLDAMLARVDVKRSSTASTWTGCSLLSTSTR